MLRLVFGVSFVVAGTKITAALCLAPGKCMALADVLAMILPDPVATLLPIVPFRPSFELSSASGRASLSR